VERAGDTFLAAAGLADEEHRHVGSGRALDLREEAAHHVAAAAQARERLPGGERELERLPVGHHDPGVAEDQRGSRRNDPSAQTEISDHRAVGGLEIDDLDALRHASKLEVVARHRAIGEDEIVPARAADREALFAVRVGAEIGSREDGGGDSGDA